MAMAPRFFAPGLDPGSGAYVLPADEVHHLQHVLRLRAGATVTLFDGMGREWTGRIERIDGDGARVLLDARTQPVPEPSVRVTLGVGLLKGDQMDQVVRDATMMGAFGISPLVTRHVTVARRAWRSGAAAGRWQRVAVAAAKQSRRAVVPLVAPIAEFGWLQEQDAFDMRIMCVEPALAASVTSTLVELPRPATALVLIGPEGGWAPEEIAFAAQQGATFVHLGPRTIRAEAMPTAILSALWTVWGW